ncbi:hypothetical protein IVG45_04055 [Methylomonas sp. LL1]|uniref:Spy/CpxP family protein refolding chaperone n=1 Tax=Methylomonas sp. LL1 TaxID=2785785 RepID=UPI0018C41532|nr:hypothetical protein [Methylomonas sp. LL1]QPK64155.1 hypothetical protein IVG45_04055 [Methylomonas sp. LL1]
MNKKIITIALALALPLTVAAFPGDKGGNHFETHRGERVERLVKELDLSAEQKTQLEAVFEEQQAKREAIRQETHQRMQAILSPEQMTKFEDLQKNRHQKWQKRHGQRNADQQSETQK